MPRFLTGIAKRSICGIPGILDGAPKLAQEYLRDPSYANLNARMVSLIRYETAKAAAAGFAANLGGFATMPITLPADMIGNWILQGRLAAAIAFMSGWNMDDDRVHTAILCTIIGPSMMTDIAQEAGMAVGLRVTANLIKQVPGKLLIAINKAVGFRLLTKAGTTGVVNLMKWVPFVGGLVSGSISGYACNSVGHYAITFFSKE